MLINKFSMRNLVILIGLIFTITTSSQTTNYYSDFCLVAVADGSETLDGGELKKILRENFMLSHDTENSTLVIKSLITDAVLFRFYNLKFKEYFNSDSKKYKAYYAIESGDPFFISFSDEIIKIDDRKKFLVFGFMIKKW